MKHAYLILLVALSLATSAQGTRRDTAIIVNMLKANIPQCLIEKDFDKLSLMMTDNYVHEEYHNNTLEVNARGKKQALAFYKQSYTKNDLAQITVLINSLHFKKDKAVVEGKIYATFKYLPTGDLVDQHSVYTCRLTKGSDNNWYMSSITHYF